MAAHSILLCRTERLAMGSDPMLRHAEDGEVDSGHVQFRDLPLRDLLKAVDILAGLGFEDARGAEAIQDLIQRIKHVSAYQDRLSAILKAIAGGTKEDIQRELETFAQSLCEGKHVVYEPKLFFKPIHHDQYVSMLIISGPEIELSDKVKTKNPLDFLNGPEGKAVVQRAKLELLSRFTIWAKTQKDG